MRKMAEQTDRAQFICTYHVDKIKELFKFQRNVQV